LTFGEFSFIIFKKFKAQGVVVMFLKRFLVFLVVILVGLSLGLTVYYMLQSEENLSIRNTSVNINVGEHVEVEIIAEHIKSGTTYDLQSSHPEALERQADGRFLAKLGGTVVISLKSSNEKYNQLKCTVTIGDGTENYPFVVRNYEDLESIGATSGRGLDKHYVQIEDIDLRVKNPQQFRPIGNSDSVGFSGVYNGQGHTIRHLTITEPTGAAGEVGFPTTPLTIINAGLFSKIAQTGIVTNLNINDTNIRGPYQTVGAIAGINYGSIEMINVNGGSVESTAASASVGGAVGQNLATARIARISRVGASVNVTGVANVGGITAENVGSLIINCYSLGVINGTTSASAAGGIAGLNRGVLAPDGETIYKGNVISSYSISIVNALSPTYQGAVIGRNIDYATGADEVNRIYGNYYLNEVNSGFAGVGGATDPIDFYSTNGVSSVQMKSATTYKTYSGTDEAVGWNFVEVWGINSQNNNGYPTLRADGNRVGDSIWDPSIDFYYTINGGEIGKLDDIRNKLDGNFVINGDLDLAGMEWTPIGTEAAPFTGSLTVNKKPSGGYYVIRNLKISTFYQDAGLFGYIGNTAALTGVTIEGVNITNGANIGSIVGRSKGVVTACSAYRHATDPNYQRIQTIYNGDVNVGSLVGRLDVGGNITSSLDDGLTVNFATLDIRGTPAVGKHWNVGGIVGLSYADVKFANFGGSIKIEESNSTARAGGVVGTNSNNAKVISCIARSPIELAVNRETYAGGLVGYNDAYARVQFSFATGDTMAKTAGGLLGYNEGPFRSASMEECYAKDGTVYGGLVGGLVGYHYRGEVVNCYTLVSLSGNIMGGFAGVVAGTSNDNGSNLSTADITYCYSAVSFIHQSGSAYYETSSPIRKSWTHTIIIGQGANTGDGESRGKQAGYVRNCIINTANTGNAARQESSYNLFQLIQIGSPNDGLRNDSDCRGFSTYIDRGFNTAIWGMQDNYPALLKVVLS